MSVIHACRCPEVSSEGKASRCQSLMKRDPREAGALQPVDDRRSKRNAMYSDHTKTLSLVKVKVYLGNVLFNKIIHRIGDTKSKRD